MDHRLATKNLESTTVFTRTDICAQLVEMAPFVTETAVVPYLAKRIGTLSKDDDDGGENVAKKMNLPFFKHNRVYLDPLNMPNAGDFS